MHASEVDPEYRASANYSVATTDPTGKAELLPQPRDDPAARGAAHECRRDQSAAGMCTTLVQTMESLLDQVRI
jgi:hypothetical protein